jgi:hypothetical protein
MSHDITRQLEVDANKIYEKGRSKAKREKLKKERKNSKKERERKKQQ